MISDVLLALGLLLSTASQLRFMGASIGAGEICLIAWLALTLFREVARLGPPLTLAFSQLLIFWLIFAFALSVGTLTGYAIGDVHDSNLFLHDATAYPLLAAVSCFMVTGRSADQRLHRLAWLLSGFGTAALAILTAVAWGLLDIPSIEPWYWDRFRGWSANPQQLSLLCAILGLLVLHLADAATQASERVAALACAILPIYIGRLSKSDSFTVALAAAAPIFVTLKLYDWLFSFERRLTIRSALAWTAALALPVLLVSSVPFGPTTVDQATSLATGLLKAKTSLDEAELRLYSWREAISRGMDSGMLGLGPGPHLEIPPVLVTARRGEALPKFVETPPLNGTPDFEAHNTPLDLFTQGGLIAVLSFVWISAVAFFNSCKARRAGLATLLCGASVFGFGNLIIRQPLFWFAISLCLVAGEGTRLVSPVWQRS
jgi:hypothetical protein